MALDLPINNEQWEIFITLFKKHKINKTGQLIYIDAQKPSFGTQFKIVDDNEASNNKCILLKGNKKDKSAEYTFDITKSGSYFIALRVRSDIPVGSHNSLFYSIDNQPLKASHLSSKQTWGWSLAAHNKSSWTNNLQAVYLKKGQHTIKIAPREAIYLDIIAVSTDPVFFKGF